MEKIKELTSVLFIFAALAFLYPVTQVFAQGGASLDQEIQSLKSRIAVLKSRIEAIERTTSVSRSYQTDARDTTIHQSAPDDDSFDNLSRDERRDLVAHARSYGHRVWDFLHVRRQDRHTNKVAQELIRCYGGLDRNGVIDGSVSIERGVGWIAQAIGNNGLSCICNSTVIDSRIKRGTFDCS